MRNLKKVLAVLVVVAMFATLFAVPAMAETSAPDAAKIATELGLLKGAGNGVDDAYLKADTTRLQAAIIYLRLLGKEAEALAYQGENFADAKQITWQGGVNVMAYLKNNPDLGWVGDGVNFLPNQKANAQMIYKVLLTAMGYKQGTDFEWADVKGFAKAKGLSALFSKTGTINNADLATAIVEALKAPVVGGKTLAEVLVAAKVIDPAKAAAAGLIVAIASVTAPAAGLDITVGRVKDVAGNYANWLSTLAGTTTGTFANITKVTAEMTGASKIKLTVEDQLSSVGTTADYVYSVDGGATWQKVGNIATFNVDSTANKSYIELVVGYDVGDDTDLTTQVLISTSNDGATSDVASPNVKNGIGQYLYIADTTVCGDKVGPKYLSVAAGAVVGGKLTYVTLTFSEALYAQSLQETDFTVEGFTIKDITYVPGATTVRLNLNDKDNSGSEKPKVTLVGSVEDTKHNALGGSVEKTCP